MHDGETISIYNIFRSINGEVCKPGQGSWTTFIRFAGCQQNCHYCFGVRAGRRLPRIIMANKPKKKLNEMVVGDKLMTFAENKGHLKLAETTVKKVLVREVDEWFDIKINGTLYFVTGEHPFFTSRGLIQAQNLQIGDMILHSSPESKLSFRMLGTKNPMKNPETVKKMKESTDWEDHAKKTAEAIRKKKLNGTYLPTFKLLSKEKQKETRRKMSFSKMGEKNPNWKNGGKKPNYSLLVSLCATGIIKCCTKCKSSKHIQIHHKDGDPTNDSFANLKILCKSCHSTEHKMGLNFWKGERKDGKKLKGEAPVLNGFEVQSIKKRNRFDFPQSIRPKPLKVYNLSCSPYNSYLIDYMWVHNCDTEYAKDINSGANWIIDEVVKRVGRLKCHNITITGGEPLIQKEGLRLLLWKLGGRGFHISIETNGIFPILEHFAVSWVVDFKLPSSGEYNSMAKTKPWHQLTKNDYIKFVIDTSTRTDYDIALTKVQQFWSEGVKAQIVFSPIMRYLPGAESYIPRACNKLYKWMQENQLFQVLFNVQLHKLIQLKEPD